MKYTYCDKCGNNKATHTYKDMCGNEELEVFVCNDCACEIAEYQTGKDYQVYIKRIDVRQ